MLLSSDKLVIMKIVTCALVTIFIITRLSDDNITLTNVDKQTQKTLTLMSDMKVTIAY